MREIKFRGRCTKTGEWVYGSLILDRFSTTGAFIQEIPDTGCTVPVFNSDKYQCFDLIPVEYDSVGQFTGLKDKNGVEIYEGDIVETNVLRRIDPNNKWAGTQWVIEPFEVKYKGQEFYPEDLHECEIIGNIHEHSELLEVGS